jgi:hypothetical protein
MMAVIGQAAVTRIRRHPTMDERVCLPSGVGLVKWER